MEANSASNPRASDWHRERRNSILQSHPEIFTLLKEFTASQSSSANAIHSLLSVFVPPVLHFLIAYYCQYLSLVPIFVLAYTLGSILLFKNFTMSHQVIHALTTTFYPGLNKMFTLHYLNAVDITPLTFYYFYYGHLSHHTLLGEQSFNALFNITRSQDADIGSHTHRLYQFKITSKTAPRYFYPFLRQTNVLVRSLFCGVLYPIFTTFLQLLLILPLSFYHLVKQGRKSELALWKMIGLLRHTTIVVSVNYLLLHLAGWNALMYLWLSHLFYEGFLFHPYLAYWISVHRSKTTPGSSEETKSTCQPTHSLYGPLASLIMFSENYHVEHHDFPEFPLHLLDSVYRTAPEYYDTISRQEGIFATIYEYVTNVNGEWIYGCQS